MDKQLHNTIEVGLINGTTHVHARVYSYTKTDGGLELHRKEDEHLPLRVAAYPQGQFKWHRVVS